MSKKQGVIITVLVLLIALAGVLATRLNGSLDAYQGGAGDIGKSAISVNKTKKTSTFTESKLSREQEHAKTVQTLKTLIDDKSVSSTSKKDAEAKFMTLTLRSDSQEKIETILKSKGYEDVLCTLNDNKASILLKSEKTLTEKQTREIHDVVMSVAKLGNVEIEVVQ